MSSQLVCRVWFMESETIDRLTMMSIEQKYGQVLFRNPETVQFGIGHNLDPGVFTSNRHRTPATASFQRSRVFNLKLSFLLGIAATVL